MLHLSEKARVQGTGRARLASRNPAQASEGEGPEKLLPSGLSVDGLRSTADTPAEDRIWTLQAFKKDVNKKIIAKLRLVTRGGNQQLRVELNTQICPTATNTGTGLASSGSLRARRLRNMFRRLRGVTISYQAKQPVWIPKQLGYVHRVLNQLKKRGVDKILYLNG